MTFRRHPRPPHELRIITSVTLVAFGALAQSQTDFSSIEVKASHVAKIFICVTGSADIGVSVGPDGILM